MKMPLQSHKNGRYDVETTFSMDDPRVSREAAWRAVERGFISPDPRFGAGLDEFDFPATANHESVGVRLT